MFLKLAHTNLDVYKYSYELTLEAYRITKLLPESEKYNLVSQIRRAAISVRMNIAEGSSRKSNNERSRYYEIARGSVIEIDAALDIVYGLEYFKEDHLVALGDLLIKSFKLLTGMINR